MNWSTVASLATAAGTLVLAVATFSAVRSSTQSARIAERALLIRTRPLLMTSRLDDPPVKFRWMDDHWVKLDGSRAHAAVDNGVVYLAVSVRNVASGVAVLQGWYPHPEQSLSDTPFPALEDFRRQSRDLYIAAGDVGFWQGALREPDDPVRLAMVEVVESAPDLHHRCALQRSRRRSARHDPLPRVARRRRRVDRCGGSAVQRRPRRPQVRIDAASGQIRSMMVTLAWPPPSHMTWRP